jgi:phosphate transport system substrate-binding protein
MVKRFVAFASVLFLFFVSCKTKKPQPADTGTTGTIHISVDEAFKPIIEEQIQVFESAYPKAKIIAHYKPEAECWQDCNQKADKQRGSLLFRFVGPVPQK